MAVDDVLISDVDSTIINHVSDVQRKYNTNGYCNIDKIIFYIKVDLALSRNTEMLLRLTCK